MGRLFSRTLLLSWAIWLGGLVGVLVAVTTIFAVIAADGSDASKAEAGRVAANVFGKFERVMLLTAAVALVSMLGLAAGGRSRIRTATMTLLILAGLTTALSTAIITPKINTMRLASQTHTPEFRKLHGLSMAMYTGTAGLLAIVGLLLPSALRSNTAPGKALEVRPEPAVAGT